MPLAHPLISFRWQATGLKLTGTLGGSAPKLYDPWFTFRTVPWGLEESQRTLPGLFCTCNGGGYAHPGGLPNHETVTHPGTNRARRRATSLIRPTTLLPLRHAAIYYRQASLCVCDNL